uniref:Uncharacterized protein n=1 Tax=Panagrolaimus sp. PS1159 TaxID=55785 RepID=A0AC35F8Z7_9BILA
MPTLEIKLSPEFKDKIRTMLNGKNFQNCNHFSWIQTTKKKTTVENSIAPIIDDSRCFTKYQNGRSFFKTYKSSTPNSTDGRCNIDRVEIHPCYNESNPMNIFWGVNDTVLQNAVENVYCNGTVLDGPLRNFYSFSPPVIKYPMIDTMISLDFFNRTISSAAFFFQCPKCVLAHRI